ncbi:hypothetical protein PTSG_00786 [Salpingoeca rosetta]|uniref:Uncharacterized protein n=1 Tax=Salpingoeca rosetta (strain ATCC 50818 / BSB-021) TaxID=946362 RepID=F2TXH0_SALR5|nr:uncharacterized protein PTSG_00786 [Salpingoeca rosetta]EGD76079.1 hypothetical protein PTSG_00786 [Salpingoeca rosetta]|eukprot:XP_004998254.1 hypothetical protein PTSG_00786 [Salpingoeca rosetta]
MSRTRPVTHKRRPATHKRRQEQTPQHPPTMRASMKLALLVGAVAILLTVASTANTTSLFGHKGEEPKPAASDDEGSFVDSVKTTMAHTAESISDMADRVQHTITDPFRGTTPDRIVQDAEQNINSFEKAITETVDDLLERADALRTKYSNADTSEWTPELKKQAKTLERRLRWRANSLQNLKKSFKWSTDYVQDFLDDVREATQSRVQQAAHWTEEKAEAGRDFAREQAHEFAEKFPALIETGRAEMRRRLSRDNIEATWEEAEHAMETAAESVWDSEASVAVRNRVNDLLKNGSEFARGVYEDTRRMMQSAKEAGEEQRKALTDTTSQLSNFLETQAKHTRSTVIEPMFSLTKPQSASDEVCEAVQEEYSRAEGAVQDLLAKFDVDTQAQCGLTPPSTLERAAEKAKDFKDTVVNKAKHATDEAKLKLRKLKDRAHPTN